MKNKYKNAEEFIKEFKKSSLFLPQMSILIKSGELADITKKKLKEYGINPDHQGYYKNSQFLELSQRFKVETRKKIGSLYSVIPPANLKGFDFIPDNKAKSYAFRKLLLLTFSEKFRQETMLLRKKYKIPEAGFKTNQDMDKKWEPPTSKSGFKQFIKDIHDLFQKHRIRLPLGAEVAYIVIKTNRQIITKHLEAANPLISSIAFERLRLLLPDPYFALNNYFSVIAAAEPVSKEQLISHINKNWPKIKKDMNKHFGQSALSQNFKRDFLTYSYHKSGKNDQEIQGLLRQYGFKNVSAVQIRKIISRLKKRIRFLEKL